MKLDQMNGRYVIPKQNVSRSIINLMKKMLECDPAFRLSSAELWSLIDDFKDTAHEESKEP